MRCQLCLRTIFKRGVMPSLEYLRHLGNLGKLGFDPLKLWTWIKKVFAFSEVLLKTIWECNGTCLRVIWDIWEIWGTSLPQIMGRRRIINFHLKILHQLEGHANGKGISECNYICFRVFGAIRTNEKSRSQCTIF